MQTIHIIVLIGGVWLLLGLFFWALIHGGKDMQPDLDEADERYVDQDGEQTYYPGLRRVGNVVHLSEGKHDGNAVLKAMQDAATFHRAE